jgi:hypothetical protein
MMGGVGFWGGDVVGGCGRVVTYPAQPNPNRIGNICTRRERDGGELCHCCPTAAVAPVGSIVRDADER